MVVQCTDAGSPPYSKSTSFNITITDVNEAPYNITLSGDHVVQEHSPKGSVIGNLACEDQDFDQNHVFTVTGPSAKVFEVCQK